MPAFDKKGGLRAMDANGDPVSGAKANFYQAGTTTPVTVYLDAALSIPFGPTSDVSDSAGWFPPIYVATGIYKVDLTTSADVSLPGYSIDNYFIQATTSIDMAESLGGALSEIALITLTKGQGYVFDGTEIVAQDIPDNFRTITSFGAIGDGTTDDTAALVSAIDHSRTTGPVDGGGLTYKITSQLTAVPGTIRNLTIDASTISDTTAWEPTAAEYESSKSLTADARQGARVFSATAHGYAVGDVVLVTSDLELETATNALCAHWGKIRAVTADTFTTYEATRCNILTANSAIVRRLPASNAARIEGLTIKGGTTCKNGFQPKRFTNLYVNAFYGADLSERALSVLECYRPHIASAAGRDADAPGLGYIISAAGNGYTRIDYAEGHRARHVVTLGVFGGIPEIGSTVGDVFGFDCLSAALDTHPGAIDVQQTGRVVAEVSDESSNEDGIVWQGVGGSVFAQFSGTFSRNACLVQPTHVDAAFDTPPSFRFDIRGGHATQNGVSCDLDGCGNIHEIDITYHGTAVSNPVFLDVGSIEIENIKIAGHGASTGSRCMQIVCEAATNIGSVELSGRWNGAGTENVYIIGPTDAGSRTIEWSFMSGTSLGGTYGLRAHNKVSARVGAFLTGSTAASLASGTGSTVTVFS